VGEKRRRPAELSKKKNVEIKRIGPTDRPRSLAGDAGKWRGNLPVLSCRPGGKLLPRKKAMVARRNPMADLAGGEGATKRDPVRSVERLKMRGAVVGGTSFSRVGK